MQWYYEKNGEQQGPVSEAALKQMVEVGTLPSSCLIWQERMDDWAPFSDRFPSEGAVGASGVNFGLSKVACPTCGTSVMPSELIPTGVSSKICPNCSEAYAQSLKEGVSEPVVTASKRRGTGGATPVGELKAIAREALLGNWGIAVLVTFLFGVVSIVMQFVPIIGPIAALLCSGPLILGYAMFFLGLVREEPVEASTLFSGFSAFLQGFLIYLLLAVMIALFAALAAVPGITLLFLSDFGGNPEQAPMFVGGVFLAAFPAIFVYFYFYLKYSLAYFVAADNPDMGVVGILKRSGDLMKGRKLKLFLLFLSFIGWGILTLFTFYIGMLWLAPYVMTSLAAFYDDIGESSEIY